MNDLEKKLKALAAKMTPKHVEFVEAYLNTPVASMAYTAVYGAKKSRHTADVNGSKLLRSAKVRKYLDMRFEQRRSELAVDPLFSIKDDIKILHSDYAGQTMTFVKEDLEKLEPSVRLLIQDVKAKESQVKKNNEWVSEWEYTVTFRSKDKAADRLNKLLGGYNTKIDLKGELNLTTFTDIVKKLEDEGKV